jgi:hypothetical protein
MRCVFQKTTFIIPINPRFAHIILSVQYTVFNKNISLTLVSCYINKVVQNQRQYDAAFFLEL